jgi:hypothetical protein
MTNLTDLQHNVLIDELKDRGYVTLHELQMNSIVEELEGAYVLENVITEIRDALVSGNLKLAKRLTQKIIYAVTGEILEYQEAA